ncbi:hypothetical protein GBAR_LOCUS29993 [Geodia barretti]|uniref:Uncharacterized protein n=1 Tax=Geodia barretti TaxID=519541 RepID=A0AA35TW27_GEOBA|nr:hypothetical protein GBAR_LOCUS29993 [Geodia barretti]
MEVGRWTLPLQEILTPVAFTGRKLTPAGLSVGMTLKLAFITPEKPCDAKRKKMELWTAVSGLLALISRAYHNFSL